VLGGRALQPVESLAGLREFRIMMPCLPVRTCPPRADYHSPVGLIGWPEELSSYPTRCLPRSRQTRAHGGVPVASNASAPPPDVAKAADALFAICARNVFPDLHVTWGTYPNNLGHEDDPECFRCHDGDHSTPDGSASIDQDCSSCHEAVAIEEASPEILTTLGLSDLTAKPGT
jgi:hypothetical protein